MAASLRAQGSSTLPFSLASSLSSIGSSSQRPGGGGGGDSTPSPSPSSSADTDTIRLEDYLDDRLQTAADLFGEPPPQSSSSSAAAPSTDVAASSAAAAALPALLASVDSQRAQLAAQLDDATRALAEAREAVGRGGGAFADKVDAFWALQRDVDRRLADGAGIGAGGGGGVGGGDVTAAAAAAAHAAATVSQEQHLEQTIARLERPLAQLRRVELAMAYVALVGEVEALRASARAALRRRGAGPTAAGGGDARAAVAAYARLKRLARALKDSATAGGEGAPAAAHVVAYAQDAAAALWDEMKTAMAGELREVLRKRAWPGAVLEARKRIGDGTATEQDVAAAGMDPEWTACVEKLLDLQMPEMIAACEDGAAGSTKNSAAPTTLLAVDVMCGAFVDAFRYHFMGTKPTSAPQAVGTYCFPWFLELVERWEPFLEENLGPVLASKFAGTAVGRRAVYVDPVCAFVASMLPVVREKVDLVMQEALRDPAFLSSFLAQLMTFDDGVRARFDYDEDDNAADDAAGGKGWPGLASEVLDRHFDAWLGAEKAFALERFREIRASRQAHAIDYEYAARGRMKPTHGAVRVTDLLTSVAKQYSRVRSFSHRLRFLIDIQLEILDAYHTVLADSLDAYYSMTSAVGRTLHGVTKEQLAELEGTGAFETLCKVIGSADHVINSLKDWSNEEFFVTLWDELQTRAKKTSDPANLAGGMSYEQVKDRTSSAVGSDDDGGALFDETIAAFGNRRRTALDFLVAALVDSHRQAFAPYIAKAQWTSISGAASADPAQLAISPGLDEPLRILKRNLDFLARALSTAAFRRVWRSALEKLQDMLWAQVLMTHKFSTLGAAQLVRDVQAVSGLLERHLPDGAAQLAVLQDGVALLGLPLSADDGADDVAEGGEDRRPMMTLGEVSDKVYTDNTVAKRTLDELGLENLTPATARKILERRVENSE